MLPAMRKRTYVPSVFDHFFGRDLLSPFFNDGADYSVPAVNIRESETSYEIELAVPGMNRDDLKINLENDILTISSENKSDKEEKTEDYMRREFSYKSFSRSFSLPDTVDSEKIKATHSNGILKLELPKMKEEVKKSKTIKIS